MQPNQPGIEQPTMQDPAMQKQSDVEQPGFNAQEAFDKFTINALKILHTPETTDRIISSIKAKPDIIEAIGEQSLNVVRRLEESASGNKFNVKANTVLNGLNVIVGEVINIIEATGVPKLEDEQKYQAYSWAVSNYINEAVKTGRISKEELVKLGEQMGNTKQGQAIAQQIQQQPKNKQPPGQQQGMPVQPGAVRQGAGRPQPQGRPVQPGAGRPQPQGILGGA